MKKKFLNTKNVVIGLVSLVLIGASATGVAVFLKDRGEAAAAEQEQVQNLPATGREENNNQTDENITIPSENNTTVDNTQIPTEPSTTEGATPGETTRPGTTGTTTRPRTEEAVAGIEETVRIEERKVFEDLKLSWTTLAIPAITADMGIFKPVLGIEKTATAVVRANQEEQIPVTENNVPMVRAGDTIIYTIKVSNSGNYKATNVVVTDSLDVIFDGQTVKANEELAKIETLDAGKQATLKVGYVVTQDDIETVETLETADGILEVQKNIENKVYATDGKTTVEDEDKTVPVNPDVTISGTKTWVDNNNAYQTRPESIVVNLIAGNDIVAEQEIRPDAEGNWTYTFTNLPKYDDNKNEIIYQVSENELDNYTYQVSEKGYDIKNTIKQDSTVTVEGSKKWITPVEDLSTLTATIELYRDGVKVEGKTKTVRGNGTYKFENLDKYDLSDGHIYNYTVKEVEVEGYTTEQTGNNFKNTIAQDSTVIVEGSKKWITPVEDLSTLTATIELYRDNEKIVTTTVSGNSTYKFENLDKYNLSDGHIYNYTVKEVEVEGYTTEQTGNNFKNTITQDYVSLSGNKIWIDPVGTKHDTITLQVYQNNEPYKVNGVDYSIELADGATSFSFTGLPKYKVDSEGNYILANGKVQLNEYKVVETTGQTGYIVSYSTVTQDNNGNYTQNVTNSLEQTQISFTANKDWVDEGTVDNRKDITVELYKNNVATGITKTINKGQTSCTFEDLEKYTIELDEYGEVTSFTENRYAVRETDITGYTPSYSEVTKSGTTWSQTITNTIDQTTTTVTVNKVWDTAKDITKPTITINLYKNDEYYDKIELTDGQTTHTFTGLPKYKTDENGNLIVENGKVVLNIYTAREEVMPEYTTTYSDDTLTITNTAKGIVKVTSHSTTATQNTVPVDVVLVLDVSGSMLEYNSSDANNNPQSKAEDMVSAVNSAIASIRSKNPENRVSVVAFSSTSKNTKTQVLLPLGKYTAKSSGQYLTYSDNNEWDWKYTKVESAEISTNVNGKDTVTVSVKGGTYTQTGIYEGARQLLNATVTYDKDGEGTEYEPVTRIPIMMLLTDGLPTYASTTWNGKPTDPANAPGSGNGLKTSADEAYYTIRTAHHYKGEIGKHYNNTEAKFYTIGFGVSSSDKLANAILNPTATNITACKNGNSTEKGLYNMITKDGTSAGAYSYADGSYLGIMDTTELTNIMNNFINSNTKVTTERVMTETELTNKKVELTNIDTSKEFEISYGTTKYNFEEAKVAGLVKPNDEVGPYYVDLSGIDTTEQIVIKYNTKTVEQ